MTLLIVVVNAQAWIAFASEREGSAEIYVMEDDGTNQQNLTNNPHSDVGPAWFNSPFSVSPAGKKSRYRDGSNRLINNINYRLFPPCIEVVFENKRRVNPLISILSLEAEIAGKFAQPSPFHRDTTLEKQNR